MYYLVVLEAQAVGAATAAPVVMAATAETLSEEQFSMILPVRLPLAVV